MAAIRMQFFMIMGIVYLNISLVKMLDEQWADVLALPIGKITIAVIATVSVICCIILMYITKPLNYKI